MTVKVVSIRGDKIRLAITAPEDVAVDREELRKAKIESGDYEPATA